MITKEHKSVGIYLGLSNDKLNALDVEYPLVGERIIAMLNAWRDQMTKKATRSNLIKALVKVNRNDAAEKVTCFISSETTEATLFPGSLILTPGASEEDVEMRDPGNEVATEEDSSHEIHELQLEDEEELHKVTLFE